MKKPTLGISEIKILVWLYVMAINVLAVDALAVPPPEYSGGGWRDFCLTQ